MNDKGQCETQLSDHVSRFWKLLETETVHLSVNIRRVIGHDAPDGPTVYYDVSTFSDAVAKELVRLRSRTPSAPDVAMREALREKLQRAIIRPKSHDGPVRLCDQIDEVMKIVDAALSTSEAKSGEPVPHGMVAVEGSPNPGDILRYEIDEETRVGKVVGHFRPAVDREAVARIIDPVSWRVMDYELEQMKRKYRGKQIGWPADQFKDKASLKKADAILSILAPTAPAQEGE